MLSIETLVSTMNRKDIDFIKEMNLEAEVTIINQGKNPLIEDKVINSSNYGLSKSRNIALEKGRGDILILTDDDVVYEKGYSKIIRGYFEKNKDIDILTYKVKTLDGKDFKVYKEKGYKYNLRTLLKVSSIEIAIRRSAVERYNLRYDEDFGLGSRYETGEENILLYDAYKKGAKIAFSPVYICRHPKVTSGKNLDNKTIYSKGALFYRLFSRTSLLMNLVFILKKRREINFSLIKAIQIIYKGGYDYKKSIDNNSSI